MLKRFARYDCDTEPAKLSGCHFDKGGGSPPAAPAAPDPAAQIAAEAKINRYNVVSPFGRQTWIPPTATTTTVASQNPATAGRWEQVLRQGNSDDANYYENVWIPGSGGESTTTTQTGDGPWTQQIELDPSQQRQFDARNQIAEAMLARGSQQFANLPKDPFSYGSVPTAPSSRATFGDFAPGVDDSVARELVSRLKGMSDTPWNTNVDGSAVRNAVLAKARMGLDPTYNRLDEQLDQKLTNMGLPIGSEAWAQARDQFGRERASAYESANLDSIIQGANEEQNQFGRALGTRQQNISDIVAALSGAQSQTGAEYGRGLQTRQQNVGEMADDYSRAMGADQANYGRALSTRQQNYNELAALLGGQQLNPMNPTGGAVDTGGAYANAQAARNMQYQGQLAGYNSGVAGNNAAMGGLFQLGASMLGGPAGSAGAMLASKMFGA